MTLDATGIFNAVVSDAATTGHLEQINQHEPWSAPAGLLTGAVWVQDIRPLPAASGLASTTVLVTLMLRIYKSTTTLPQDAIDPDVLTAVDALMGAYTADFTLGDAVRNVDVLGAHGPGMWGRAGYVPYDGALFRVVDIFLPLVVSDLWTQAA